MEWDKFQMAQTFLQRANAMHPEDAQNGAEHEQALAVQNVYYDCYMSSFSREALIGRLQQIIGGDIEMPEDEENLDEATYRKNYIREAQVILSSIECGVFRF